MNLNTIAKFTAAIALTVAATQVLAAPANGPKPRCPMGQIAVVENGAWKCKAPSIKAKEKETRGTMAPSTIKKQSAAKPDFVITKVVKQPQDGKFRVTVKNIGAAYGAKKAALWANQKTQNGNASASVYMPQVFGAGEQKYIDIQFNPANFKKGDRIEFIVDYFKMVAEKNEGNNTYGFVHP